MVPSKDPSFEPSANPTKSIKPSATPSSKPVKEPTDVPSSSPIAVPTPEPTAGPCSDNDGTFNKDSNNDALSCSWLNHKLLATTQKRKDRYCGRANVAALCPSSCGYCTCANDDSYQFAQSFNNVMRDCDYITQNWNPVKTANRKSTYCSETYGGELKGVVSYRCAASCGTCTP
jgi:hypothetical protein